MAIIDDSVELLAFIYKRYTDGEMPIQPPDVIENFEWEPGRINRGIGYLNDQRLIKITRGSGNHKGVKTFIIDRMTPNGIKTIEDKNEFKDIFGVEVGIPGFIKAKWTKEER